MSGDYICGYCEHTAHHLCEDDGGWLQCDCEDNSHTMKRADVRRLVARAVREAQDQRDA